MVQSTQPERSLYFYAYNVLRSQHSGHLLQVVPGESCTPENICNKTRPLRHSEVEN